MLVLQETDTIGRPHNNVMISTTRGPSLSVLGVGKGVNYVLMGTLLVNNLTIESVVDIHTIANSDEDFLSICTKSNTNSN